MKPLAALIAILVTLLGGIAVIMGAPPFVAGQVKGFVGLGFTIAMAVILAGPIGKALAAQLKGEQGGGLLEERVLAQLEELSQDIQLLRDDMAQMHERMDFAERLLTSQRVPERLAGGPVENSNPSGLS
jgi:hypothetical protein